MIFLDLGNMLQGVQGGATTHAMGNIVMETLGLEGYGPVVKYLANFLVLALLGVLTSQISSVSRVFDWFHEMLQKQRERRPELLFCARYEPENMTGFQATNEFKAWMELIRSRVVEGKSKTLLRMQEFPVSREIRFQEPVPVEKTNFMPNQTESFQLDDKLWCEFGESKGGGSSGGGGSGESSGDTSPRLTEYFLTVYTPNPSDRQYLLDFHDELMEKYKLKTQATLSESPHIFELKGVEKRTGSIEWSEYRFSSTRRLSHVWFDAKPIFTKTYQNFLKNETQYKRRGDPYTFSALLYGLPGCGKTSLLKALVNYEKEARGEVAHIFIISFSKVENAEMLARMIFDLNVNGHMIPLRQRILVFEDFDAHEGACVFTKRDYLKETLLRKQIQKEKDKTKAKPAGPPTKEDADKGKKAGDTSDDKEEKKDKDGGLAGAINRLTSLAEKELKALDAKMTLSDVLNVLDGINERTGQRCFWTTNVPEPRTVFDPAFLRPGRMDMIIQFGRCNFEGVRYLLDQHFDTNPEELMHEMMAHDLDVLDEKWTPAEVKQIAKQSVDVEEALRELLQGNAATSNELRSMPKKTLSMVRGASQYGQEQGDNDNGTGVGSLAGERASPLPSPDVVYIPVSLDQLPLNVRQTSAPLLSGAATPEVVVQESVPLEEQINHLDALMSQRRTHSRTSSTSTAPLRTEDE